MGGEGRNEHVHVCVRREGKEWAVCERRCERPHKSVEYESLKRLQMEAQ